jgi:hypothetical protein
MRQVGHRAELSREPSRAADHLAGSALVVAFDFTDPDGDRAGLLGVMFAECGQVPTVVPHVIALHAVEPVEVTVGTDAGQGPDFSAATAWARAAPFLGRVLGTSHDPTIEHAALRDNAFLARTPGDEQLFRQAGPAAAVPE